MSNSEFCRRNTPRARKRILPPGVLYTQVSLVMPFFAPPSAAAVYSLPSPPSSGKAHPKSITFSPSSLICHYPRLFYNYGIISCTPQGGSCLSSGSPAKHQQGDVVLPQEPTRHTQNQAKAGKNLDFGHSPSYHPTQTAPRHTGMLSTSAPEPAAYNGFSGT